MKSLALTVVMALVLVVAGGAAAQQAPSSSPQESSQAVAPSQAPAEGKNTNVEINVGSPAKPNTEVPQSAPVPPSQAETRFPEAKSGSRPSASGDDVAASPRSGSAPQSTIFGLSPVSAVVIAAALLVVVILAIVAMTRSNDTYIDTNRRI
jgi:hypothetical protein